MNLADLLSLVQFGAVFAGGVWAVSKIRTTLDYVIKDFAEWKIRVLNMEEIVRNSHERRLWELEDRQSRKRQSARTARRRG